MMLILLCLLCHLVHKLPCLLEGFELELSLDARVGGRDLPAPALGCEGSEEGVKLGWVGVGGDIDFRR